MIRSGITNINLYIRGNIKTNHPRIKLKAASI